MNNENVNKYEHLRLPSPGIEVARSCSPTDSKTLTDNRRETVQIHLQAFGNLWSYGYSVRWADGRYSTSSPGPENGFFATADNAALYAIGFMLKYKRHFTDETQAALEDAERQCLFKPLF